MIDEAIAERTQLFRHGRYIETGFPFERLSLIVRREKHAMKPLYQMHSWFARRAGSVFRAILTGLILDAHSNEDDFWQLFYSSAKPLGLICADPMMGGGSTIVEALHMGCKGVIGVDLNPIAWFVTKKELERVDLGRLEEEFKSLEKRVKPKISQFYATSCPTCRTQSDLVHVYWVKEIVCERCRKPLPLYQYYALARMGKKAWIYCPHCDECFSVSSQNDVLRSPKCPKCRRHLKPTSDGRKYFCSCGESGRVLDAVRKARKLPNARLFALQFECPNCKVLACKCPEQEDLALYRRASELLQEMRSSLPIPSLEIVKSEETCRIINYGYTRFEQLFNDRQVLSLGLLLREILRTKDQNVMEFLLLAFSKCLEFNNILVPYVYSGNKVESCFSLHEYLHAQVYVENNVWGARHGRGTFVKCYKNVYRGKEYCESPYERVYEEAKGKIVVKSIPTEPRIEARLVEHFSELNSKQQTALLRCENAENLSFVPPSSVDLVLTDPPYFDNVIYSGLADFFYAWLRPVLASRYSWMSDIQKSPKEEEIVVNKGNPSKNEETYLDAMTRVFKECARVLKRDGIMVFTFHHTKKRAWSSIISALLAAGFYVSSAWPVHSESRASPHATPGSIQFDVILTCRRRDGDGETIEWRNLRNKAEHQAKQIIDKLTGKRPSLSQEDVKTIVLGKCMELYSKHYPNVLSSGETLTAWEAIRRMETTAGSLARKRLTKDNS